MLPTVDQRFDVALTELNKQITNSTATIQRLTDALTCRLNALEKALSTTPCTTTPQTKKVKLAPARDDYSVAMDTALPEDNA